MLESQKISESGALARECEENQIVYECPECGALVTGQDLARYASEQSAEPGVVPEVKEISARDRDKAIQATRPHGKNFLFKV